MSPPKHLWSGDWQRESEAAARERAERQPPVSAAREDPESAPVAAVLKSSRSEPTRPSGPRRPQARRRADLGSALAYIRSHLRLDRAQARLVAIVAVVALAIVGGAYGLNALVSQGSSTKPNVSSANAWLGLQMQSLANGTVVISSVVPGSPAASAGLKPGDVITEIESRPVVSPIDVTEAVAALQAGDRIELRLVRGSSTYTVRVKLTARPASFP